MIEGRCHCGNIAYTLTWEPPPDTIAARACDCGFCTRHGALWTSNPAGLLTLTIRDGNRLTRYAFETRTADFLICSTCGVAPAVVSRIDERDYAVVNVNTFVSFPVSRIRRAPVSLGDEDERVRLDRRRRGWIADVRIRIAS